MQIYSIIPLLSAVFSLSLGALALSRFFKQKKDILLVLGLFCIAVTIWLFGTFMMFRSTSDASVLFWDRFIYSGVIFIPVLMHHLSISFAQLQKQKKFLWFGYIVSFIFLVISRTNLFVSGVFRYQWGSHAIAQLFHHIFIVFFFAYVAIFFVNIWAFYKKSKDVEIKNQAKYIFAAFLILITVGAAAYLPAYKIPVPPFPFVSGLLFIVILSYAILKHELLDIKVAGAVFFTSAILILLFVDIFMAKGTLEIAISISAFIIMAFFGYLLIRSVQNEINQRVKMELLSSQLQSANEKLKQVDAMKTEFISMASHELLTPISAIEGYLSMMLDEHMVTIEDPKARQYMESVYKSSKRLARLVTDLLNVSRIEQGRMSVEKKEIDLKALIDEVIKELKFKAEEKHHQIMAQVRDGINTEIYVDEDKIKEVIINLAGNAIKYTKDGGKIGIGVDIWPTSEVEKRFGKMQAELKEHSHTTEGALQNIVNEKFAQLIGDKQIIILVKDTGIGITHEDIGRLFQKFSRVGDWSTQEVQGTGLGLYISRALVEMHHGRIWVESEGEDKGSTFYFSLPTIEVEEEEKALDAEVPVAKDAKPMAKPAAKVEG